MDDGGTWSNDVQSPRSKMLRRGRRDTSAERGLVKVGQSPSEGPSYHSHPEGRNRVAELVHHQGPVGGQCPLQKPGLLQMEI